jgi:DNA-binding SARP family transcriptional activator/Tol biopolymer transport system component
MRLMQLRTLGTLDLRGADGRELHSLLAQSKRMALLAYLCLAKPRGFHRRDTLVGLFWPDSDQEHARTSLRKSLHILRRTLGEDVILSRGDEDVSVNFERVSCDVIEFEESLGSERFQDALELYRGDLLAGFFIDEAPEFDQWLHTERTRLRACAARAALKLSDQREASGEIAAAVISARRSLELSDPDEAALRKLIELQNKSGDRAGAIETYQTFARRLAAEYQTEPSAETQSLIERIRMGAAPPTLETPVTRSGEQEPNGQPSVGARVSTSREVYQGGRRVDLRKRMLVAAAGIVVLFSVGSLPWFMRPESTKQVLRYRLTIDSVEPLAVATGWAGRIAISPDGSRFVYVSGSRNGPDHPLLRIRLRNELHGTPVPGTDDANSPFFSPDGHSIGFLRQKSVWIVSPTGGPPIHLSDSLNGVAGASWGTDGFIYADGFEMKPLVRVEAKKGATPKWFTSLDSAKGEIDHLWPVVLPNANGVIFTVGFSDKDKPNGQASFGIAIADIPSGKHRMIIQDGAYPVYVSTGYLLYVTTKRTLMVVPFDQNSMLVTGQPTPLVDGMRFGSYAATDLAVSSTGTLVYSVGAGLTQYQSELLWIARDGKATPVDPDWQGMFNRPAISPDGKLLAISKSPDGQRSDVWIKKLDRGPAIRLTHERPENGSPTWTPDGKSVTFNAVSLEEPELWTQRAEGTSEAVKIPHGRSMFMARWSPDGKWLIFHARDESPTQSDIFGFRPGIDTAPVPLVAGKFYDWGPEISSDGHWLAYQSDETGLFQIYVVPFPNTKAGKWAVTSAGGIHARWGPRGDELFYRDTSGDFYSVPVRGTPNFSSGVPKKIFTAKRIEFPLVGYAVAPGDQRLLTVRLLHPGAPDTLVVVENWFEELKAKARH